MEAQTVRDVLRRFPDLRMSYEEFLGLGAGVHGDWIDGRARLQAESETERHSDVLGFLMSLLRTFAGGPGRGKVLSRFQMRPNPWLPSREVDLLYVASENRGRVRKYFVDGPADLVIEVVSDASRQRDRFEKVREYEDGGVQEYWIVDVERETAEIHRLNDTGRYEVVAAGRSVVLCSEVLPGFSLRADWLWPGGMPDLLDVWNQWGPR